MREEGCADIQESEVTKRRMVESSQPWRLSKGQRQKEYLESFSYSQVKWHLFYWICMRFSHNKLFVPEPGLNLLLSWPKALWTSGSPSFIKKKKKVGLGNEGREI